MWLATTPCSQANYDALLLVSYTHMSTYNNPLAHMHQHTFTMHLPLYCIDTSRPLHFTGLFFGLVDTFIVDTPIRGIRTISHTQSPYYRTARGRALWLEIKWSLRHLPRSTQLSEACCWVDSREMASVWQRLRFSSTLTSNSILPNMYSKHRFCIAFCITFEQDMQTFK